MSRSRFATPSIAPGSGAAQGREMERVDLFITDRCNQRCIFCYLCSRGLRKMRSQFPRKDIEDALAAGRRRGYDEVYISGGEPTVDPRLPDIIRRSRELGYERVKMMSNGIRLADPRYAFLLAASGLTHLALSVHGASAGIYAAVHGRTEDFARCARAVENLHQRASGVSVEINTVATRENLASLPALCAWTQAAAISRLHAQLLVPNSPEAAAHFPGHRRAAAVFRRVLAEYGSRLRISFAFIPPCLMGEDESAVPGFDFTMSFFTNRPDMILTWQRSLLAAKRVLHACARCLRWPGCRGFWAPAGPAGAVEKKW